jgi:hypothetical protein
MWSYYKSIDVKSLKRFERWREGRLYRHSPLASIRPDEGTTIRRTDCLTRDEGHVDEVDVGEVDDGADVEAQSLEQTMFGWRRLHSVSELHLVGGDEI